jgi:glycosyltransferase involved in cell wall biosynthesis
VSNVTSPSVSIGLPVRNGEEYLRIALDSLLAQDYRDFELNIWDNASDDGTSQICLEYARADSRIRFHRSDTNVGAAENFNRVFRISRGKYFMWAAHDDRWHPSFVSRCLEGLEQNHDAVLCASTVQFIDKCGVKLDDAALRDLKVGYNRLNTCSMNLVERVKELSKTINWYALYGLIRTDVLRQTKLVRDAYGGDVLLLMELLFHGETLILADPLFEYRLIQKTHERHAEDLTGKSSQAEKPKPYTQLAYDLLDLIGESVFSPSIKTILRDDFLENVSFANQSWASTIAMENQLSVRAGDDRHLTSIQIRDLLARLPPRAPEELRELRELAFEKYLSDLSAPGRLYRRIQRVLNRHLFWRFRPKA